MTTEAREQAAPTLSAAQLAKAYVKIREAREALAKEYDTEDQILKDQQEVIKGSLLEICKTVGADSIKTPNGTIVRSVKSRYWTSDWESMYAFMTEHDALDLLEKRLHQGNLKAFLEENPDLLPPGLNSESEFTISVRKS